MSISMPGEGSQINRADPGPSARRSPRRTRNLPSCNNIGSLTSFCGYSWNMLPSTPMLQASSVCMKVSRCLFDPPEPDSGTAGASGHPRSPPSRIRRRQRRAPFYLFKILNIEPLKLALDTKGLTLSLDRCLQRRSFRRQCPPQLEGNFGQAAVGGGYRFEQVLSFVFGHAIQDFLLRLNGAVSWCIGVKHHFTPAGRQETPMPAQRS